MNTPMKYLMAAFILVATGLRAENTIVENSRYLIVWNDAAATLQLEAKAFHTVGIPVARLPEEIVSVEKTRAKHPAWGKGSALKAVHKDGSFTEIMLFEKLPFIALQRGIRNGTDQQLQIDKFPVIEAELDFGKPAGKLVSRGTAGLQPVDAEWASYVFNALGDPETGAGVVFGWASSARGQGIVFPGTKGETPTMRARVDYGDLRLPPGGSEKGELLLVGIFEDVRTGLELYAQATAEHLKIKLRPVPGVYCTWYHGGASTAERFAANTDYASEHLKPFGLGVMQIDDKWQPGIQENGPKKIFDTHDPQGPYPDGMKAAADYVRSRGMVPGLWFMPFSGAWYDPFFADKQDIFYRTGEGDTAALQGKVLKPLKIEPDRPLSEYPYSTSWAGTSIDCTNPKAQEYVRQMVARISHDWGYKYFKMDGFHCGTGSTQKYVDNEYREDDLGKTLRHNPLMTPIEGYRTGLQVLRDAAGDDVFFLACCQVQNMRCFGTTFGMVDAMRVGPDNGASWDRMLRGINYGTRYYFLNKRVWHCDPDPIYVRPVIPMHQAVSLASWVTLAGQLNATSYQYSELPPERVDIIKRTLPSHTSTESRPVDFLQNNISSIWLLKDGRSGTDRTVAGFFNWEESEPTTHSVGLEKLELDPSKRHVGFDYWGNRFIAPVSGKLIVSLGGAQCRIVSLYPECSQPQLVGTSRHITQGIVDVVKEQWNGKGKLSGESRVVAGDPYELRIVVPIGTDSWKVESASAKGATGMKWRQDGACVRVSFVPEKTGELKWTIVFERGAVEIPAMPPLGGLKANSTAWNVSLTWDDVPGAYGYLLKRKEGGQENRFHLNSTSFVDGTVQLKKNYTYEVSPLDWNGKPGAIAVLKVAMPQQIEKPAAPPKPDVPLPMAKNGRKLNNRQVDNCVGFNRDQKVICPIPAGAKRFVANVEIDPALCKNREIVFSITSDVKEMGEPPLLLARSEALDPKGWKEWCFNLELDPRARELWIECRAVKGSNKKFQAAAFDAGFME